MLKHEDGPTFGLNYSVCPPDPVHADTKRLESAAAKVQRDFHRHNFHTSAFEPSLSDQQRAAGQAEYLHRKQHFVRGQVPGSSVSNTLIYGSNYTNNIKNMKREAPEKPSGLLYGSSDAATITRSAPGALEHKSYSLPHDSFKLEERSVKSIIKNRKLAADQDEYLARHYEEKAKISAATLEEKRQDFEDLKRYMPWGKPGGGAPRIKSPGDSNASRTKMVHQLKQESYQPLSGRPGGGDPYRTESGRPKGVHSRNDSEIRFQAKTTRKDVDPFLRYKGDRSYGDDLGELMKEASQKRIKDKMESRERDIKHITVNPFGRPGAGAPIKDTQGHVKTGLPQTLGELTELRNIETRHPHAYNIRQASGNRTKKVETYDPWGQGYGAPVRDKEGKVLRQKPNTPNKNDEGIEFGRPGGGAPNAVDGKVVLKKTQTLNKDHYGNALRKEFSPKTPPSFDPWGKPGAGAPTIKGPKSKPAEILTAQGLITKSTASPNQKTKETRARQDYLKTLQTMSEEQRQQRRAEKAEIHAPKGADVANWMRQGVIGQPKYDPVTKEIIGTHKTTSDVTQQKMMIRRQKNENSERYHHDLSYLAEERHQLRKREKATEQKMSVDHVAKMDSVWGKPGAGAPLDLHNKQKLNLEPADTRIRFRDS